MALSIISDKFRIENAKKFVQSMKVRAYPNDFSDVQSDYERVKSSYLNGEVDNMYMIIGKITSWYGDGVEEPIPDVSDTPRQESEIWSNAISAKRVDTTNVSHVTFRENWTSGTEYPFYSSTESNTSTFSSTSTPNFFVLDENEFRVYKCLFNNYGANSTQPPTFVGGVGGDPARIQREPFYTSDGYLWKYMYTIDPSLAISFLTDEYMPVRKDTINDSGTDDNASVDGAIYRIYFPQKTSIGQSVSSPSGDAFARVRVEGIDSSTDVTTSGLTIDLSNTDNDNRIASSSADNDGMVGYQVEHVIDEAGDITIEIAEIVASTVQGSELQLTVKRLDNESATQFSVPATATETWFISPLIDIRGEGENASAMLFLNGEDGFNSNTRKFTPTSDVTEADALDIIMNTVGNGYYNVYRRNDFDGSLSSLVVIRQGSAEIGSNLSGSAGATTLAEDQEILDTAEIVSVTPYGGHSYDNVSELYAYTIMINQTFAGDESGSTTVQNDFRQVALVQNPIELDDTLADAEVYRQTIRLEFNGNITTDIDYDDEISDQSSDSDERNVFGRVVKWEYITADDKTQVYLSSAFGFASLTAEEVYNINGTHSLYVSYDIDAGTTPYTELTLSARITGSGDGEYQVGLSNADDRGLKTLSGDLFYVENRTPIIRAADQSENVKLVVEY